MSKTRLRRQRKSGAFRTGCLRKSVQRKLLAETLEQRMLLAVDFTYHNPIRPEDVNYDNVVSPLDALIVINELNTNSEIDALTATRVQLSIAEAELGGVNGKAFASDVNGDGTKSPADALKIVNRLNAEGPDDTVHYLLRLFNQNGTQEIASTSVGQAFQLQVWVDDNRVNPQFPGVFTAYLDVKYDAALASVSGSIVHNTASYGNAALGSTATPGVIDGAGSFNQSISIGSPNPVLLWSLTFTATADGTLTFIGEPTTDPLDPGDVGQSPARDTAVYGVNDPVCPSSAARCFGSLGFRNVTLQIVREVDAVDDTAVVSEDSTNNPINVLANDNLFVGTVLTVDSFTQPANGQVTRQGTSNTLLYTPKADFSGVDTFTYTAKNDRNVSDTATVTLTVDGLNDGPVNTVPGAQTIDEDAVLTFAGATAISVADVDADAGGGLKVALNVANGKLTSTAGAGVTGSGTNSVTITGLVAAVNTALSGLTYTPNKDFNGSDTLVVATDDLGHTGQGGAKTDTDSVAITIRPINDAPANAVPGAQTLLLNGSLTFAAASGNAISVSDAEASELSLLLAVSQGTLKLSTTAGLLVNGDGTTSISARGLISNLNAALQGMVYTPTTGFIGSDSLTITSDDLGVAGPPGQLTKTDNVAITVAPPTRPFAAPDSGSLAEDSGSITIDVLANDLAPAGGTISITAFSQGSNGGTVTQVGSTLQYTPVLSFFGIETFTYTVQSTPTAGDGPSTGTVTVNVTAVNDAPINAIPTFSPIDEDTPLAFSAGNAIFVSDVDADASGGLTTTLSVTRGKLTSTNPAVIGSGTRAVSISGLVAAVNAALSSLTYTPDQDFSGSDTLVMVSDDQGHTGSGGAKSDSGSAVITIRPINDSPLNSVPGKQTFITNFDNPLSAASGNAVQVSDVDAGDAAVQVQLSATSGTLTVKDKLQTTVSGDGTSSVTIQGSVAAVNAVLANGLIYRNSAAGTGTLSVTTSDLGNVGGGGVQTDTDPIAFEVFEFIPSEIGGSVFIDKDDDFTYDQGEQALAGVKVVLTGTTFLNETVNLATYTAKDGTYRFGNLKPGTYEVKEFQPAGMRDGSESFEAPMAPSGDDTGAVSIGIRGGVFSLQNNFVEVGLEAQYASAFHLLASSGDPKYSSGIVLALDGDASWHLFQGSGWDGYHSAQLSMNADGKSGILTVVESATGKTKKTTITVDSARLRPSQDLKIMTVIGRASDFQFTDLAAQQGEGEGAANVAAAAAAYRHAADAVFANLGQGQARVA